MCGWEGWKKELKETYTAGLKGEDGGVEWKENWKRRRNRLIGRGLQTGRTGNEIR